MTSRELIADAHHMDALLAKAIDHRFNPWRYPDPNPYPTITLWAWLARLEDRIRRRPHIFDPDEQDDAW